MKRWILAVLIAFALAAVMVIVGLTQFRLDALQEPGHIETFLATLVKHLLVRRCSREGIPPSTDEFAGEHRGRRQTLRHRLFNVSWLRRAHTD
jgi:hypothetical protein